MAESRNLVRKSGENLRTRVVGRKWAEIRYRVST